jgi:hypothetical protein
MEEESEGGAQFWPEWPVQARHERERESEREIMRGERERSL